MKCQKCEKPATFHITELAGGTPQELHLCEDCARDYLTQSDTPESETPSLAGALAKQLAVGQTAEDLARLDKQACPVCGITFYEFRNKGRLGCPHDYVCFEKDLVPLIQSVHGESQHTGRHPKRAPADTDSLTAVIGLRREMEAAVQDEQYELASELRDRIGELRSTPLQSAEPQNDPDPEDPDTP